MRKALHDLHDLSNPYRLFFLLPPGNTTVIISNLLENQNLESIHLLLPDAGELIPVDLDPPIPPGGSREISFPWGYINRVIFETNTGTIYYQVPT